MRTAQEMYAYCSSNKMGRGLSEKQALNHFKVVEEHLIRVKESLMLLFQLNLWSI